MKTVKVFQSVDGKLFSKEADCQKHDQDCIGEAFDALLLAAMQGDKRGNVTRNDQFSMCLHLLKNRKEVLPILVKLVQYIQEEENTSDDD